MDLQELRLEIDRIDEQLVCLFQERMDLSAEVAIYKKQHNLPTHDPVREKEILEKLSKKVTDDRKPALKALYILLFELSRAVQEK